MSAYHGARFLLSAAAAAQFPPDQGAEVAIAGRSNCGKSSAINAVTGRRALARTSKTPGRTRLLNFFELAPGARLIDLPGYGYAAGPPTDRVQWARLIDALAERRSLRGLLLVVDSRRGLSQADQQLLDWASGFALPVHVLLSKVDQLARAAAHAALTAAQQRLGQRASVQLFSAHAGTGMEAARAQLDAWLTPLNAS
jgi:GTP-binding protein